MFVCVCEPVCVYVCVYIRSYNLIHAIRGRTIPLNSPTGMHGRCETSIYSVCVTNYDDHQTTITFISLPNSFKLYEILLVNDQLDAQFFVVYVYFDTLHVSSNHVLIIRRITCIITISGTCHSM